MADVLDLSVGSSKLVAEHERIVAKLLVRGAGSPAVPEGARLERAHPPEAIRIATEAWRARARHEHQSAMVFSRLLPQLAEAEASLEHKTVVLRAAMDELHHGALAAGVVRLLGGDPILSGPLATEPLPEHPGTSPKVRAVRNVLFSLALGETVGSALLAAEHELATEPAIATVLGQLAADETLHGRMGWAFLEVTLPRLSESERADVESYLPIALGTMEAELVARLGTSAGPELDEALAALGVTTGPEAIEIIRDVFGGAILPALHALGLPAERAWKDRRAAPTSLEREKAT